MTKEQLATLEEQLREALQQTGLSHHELARRSGVSQPILSRFIRGERSLTLPIASKLCQALGLKLCPMDSDHGEPESSQAEGPPAKKTRKGKHE